MLLLMCLSFTTMVLFCLAMEKHREQVLEVELPVIVQRVFRPIAWLLLAFTAYMSVVMHGWSIGPALLFGALTAALLPLILLLTYRAKLVPLFAVILPTVAVTNFYLG